MAVRSLIFAATPVALAVMAISVTAGGMALSAISVTVVAMAIPRVLASEGDCGGDGASEGENWKGVGGSGELSGAI